MSVVSQQSVEEAQKVAKHNKITNCHYFGGRPEEVLLHLSNKICFEKACVVIMCSTNRSSSCEYWYR